MQREEQRQRQATIRRVQRKQQDVFDRWGVGGGQGTKGGDVRKNLSRVRENDKTGEGHGGKRNTPYVPPKKFATYGGYDDPYDCWEERLAERNEEEQRQAELAERLAELTEQCGGDAELAERCRQEQDACEEVSYMFRDMQV